jgi:hypothetical protein
MRGEYRRASRHGQRTTRAALGLDDLGLDEEEQERAESGTSREWKHRAKK